MNWKVILGIVGVVILVVGLGVWAIGWSGGHPQIVSVLGLVLVIASLGLSFREVQEFALKRSARYGLMSIAMSVIVIIIMVFVMLISMNHPSRVDLSENRRFTLAPQTRELVKNLEEPVHLVGFFDSLMDPDVPKTEDLLNEMSRLADGKLTYELIDAFRNPELAMGYENELRSLPALFVTRRDEEQLVVAKEKAKGLTEPDITNALIRLTHRQEARIYFLTGHGEKDINSSEISGYTALRQDLENLQYMAVDFAFTRAFQLPEDCDVLAVCGPRADLYPEELEAIHGFVTRGGRLLVMADAEYELPNLVSQLRAYGLDVKNDVVIEARLVGDIQSIFSGRFQLRVDPFPVVNPDGYNQGHDITRGFELKTQYSFARSVMPLAEKPDGVTVTKLAETNSETYNSQTGEIPGSWGESDVQAILEAQRARQAPQVKFDADTDTRGPVSLVSSVTVDLNQFPEAAPGTERINEDEARIVVFGDSDFCTNRFYGPGQGEIVLNSFNWLAEQEELISTELAKVTRNTSFVLTDTQRNTIMMSAIFFLPLAVVIIGILNAIRRRKFA